MFWRASLRGRQSWLWKAWIAVAAISLIDALSILVPGVFGWLNFAHHNRQHGVSALIQGICLVAFGLLLRQSLKPSR
jgi:hypothetical protein